MKIKPGNWKATIISRYAPDIKGLSKLIDEMEAN